MCVAGKGVGNLRHAQNDIDDIGTKLRFESWGEWYAESNDFMADACELLF